MLTGGGPYMNTYIPHCWHPLAQAFSTQIHLKRNYVLPTGAFHEGSGRMFGFFLPKSQSRVSHLVF